MASWTQVLRQYGDEFLSWTQQHSVLETKGKLLAEAVRLMLFQEVNTPEEARAVWAATPAILSRCNEQSTYELPFAPIAYIWLHFLDRYARTWRALEVLVQQQCLPLAKYGVRTLDVGTGPGPSAFAVHDFYHALNRYFEENGILEFTKPPELYCVEYSNSMNHYRHNLAELVFKVTGQASQTTIFDLTRAMRDFKSFHPTQERAARFQALRNQEDHYYSETTDMMESELIYTANEAHQIAQSLHRYRLFIFSNFLTTVGSVKEFEENLKDLLNDANAGSVILVLGGAGGEYPEIYDYVDKLNKSAGFNKRIDNQTVSSSETTISNLVYEEARQFYEYLQSQCLRQHMPK